MKKAFLETSAVNAFCNNNMSGEAVRIFLENKSWLPVVGIFTTFELAKTYLNDKDIEKFKKLFLLIKELHPEFSYREDELFTMESAKLKYSHPVNPIITSEDRLRDLQVRIDEFCRGDMSSLLKNFVQDKKKNLEDSRQLWGGHSFDAEILKFKDFSEYKERFLKKYDANLLKKFLKATAQIRTPDIYISKLINNIHLYPALRTFLYSHLYLNFQFREEVPARDRITDSMQLTAASYFPIFISGDGKHLKYANEIHPDIQLISTESLGIRHL